MRGTVSLCGRPPRSVNYATVDPVASLYRGCPEVVQGYSGLVRGEPPVAGVPGERGTRGGRIDPGEGPGSHIDLEPLVEGQGRARVVPGLLELGVQEPLLAPIRTGHRRAGQRVEPRARGAPVSVGRSLGVARVLWLDGEIERPARERGCGRLGCFLPH